MHRQHEDAVTVSWQDEGGNRLDHALKSKRIKSVEIARRLKIDQSMVSRWRSGTSAPNADQLSEMLGMIGEPGLADYVLGLTPWNPADVRRLLAEVDALKAAAALAGERKR